jgi:23S rRNA (cytidine2498-2'-O)-methyltransferase
MKQERSSNATFVFAACHPGVTRWCRREIAVLRPDWLPAFSRPGFLTYKVPGHLPARFELPATFVRSYGFSLRQIRQVDSDLLVREIASMLAAGGPIDAIDRIHLWDRQSGSRLGTAPVDAIAPEHIQAFFECRAAVREAYPVLTAATPAVAANSSVLDVIQIDTGHWAVGCHIAGSIAQRWPGGIPEIAVPEEMISRAYLKTAEALMWSAMPIVRGDVCVEVGSAPGGSCQRLLECGAKVIAVDPAELHPLIASHPGLTHLKKRGRDVAHRQLSTASWLFVDTNIAPESALAMSEEIVGSHHTRFRGAVLTLKMLDDELAANIPAHLGRVQSWGFDFTKARHLAYGGQEICLAALRRKNVRRRR